MPIHLFYFRFAFVTILCCNRLVADFMKIYIQISPFSTTFMTFCWIISIGICDHTMTSHVRLTQHITITTCKSTKLTCICAMEHHRLFNVSHASDVVLIINFDLHIWSIRFQAAPLKIFKSLNFRWHHRSVNVASIEFELILDATYFVKYINQKRYTEESTQTTNHQWWSTECLEFPLRKHFQISQLSPRHASINSMVCTIWI